MPMAIAVNGPARIRKRLGANRDELAGYTEDTMGLRVCLLVNSLPKPNLGGALWVYLNWALGLQASGCQIIWLEMVDPKTDYDDVATNVGILAQSLKRHGLVAPVALCSSTGEPLPSTMTAGCLDLESAAEADLLLNIVYGASASVVRRFRRTALLDIDPGLVQIWISMGQIEVAPHDIYFSTGETVGTARAQFSDCGLTWHYTPPVVHLPDWPSGPSSDSAPYTTISSWWGHEWVVTSDRSYDNNKRTSFLEYLALPTHTPIPLELALYLGPDEMTERILLEQNGWTVRHATEVSSSPDDYRAYIQQSRGEFSCAKPSCMQLQNAWISDRTLCYLASGKPAIVQHTGASGFLPDAEGLFRFHDLDDAARALAAAEADYKRHCRLARNLAEEYFDARKVASRLVERAIG